MKNKLILLGISALFLASCTSEKKYESCIDSCQKNSTCLEYKAVSVEKTRTDGTTWYPEGATELECSRYSIGECNNICVQKHK